MISKPLATAIIIIVTVVWAVNFAAQFFVTDYDPDVSINGIFMAIVGGALALSRPGSRDIDPNDADESDEDGNGTLAASRGGS